MVGYASTAYNSGRKSASIKIITRLNPQYSGAELTYFFNDKSQSNNAYQVDSSFTGMLNIRVEAKLNGDKIADLKLDSLDFVWNHPQINLPSNYENGQKGAILEMFGWPYE